MKTKIHIFIFTIITSFLSAQNTMTITGQVTDSETSEALSGADVLIQGTILGSSTDENGRYKINSIREGDYIISISYIGYSPIIQNITIKQGINLELKFSLKPNILEISNIMVEADKPYSTASSRMIRKIDMKLRPVRSAQDMLQLAPGLIIAQHAGGGKAEQIFMRGFDADHGTDVAIDVDGLPVNMVSHGHGQGYADLHFLIPEIIENIDVYKGPYFSQYGNFSTAGAITFITKEHLESNSAQYERGAFNTSKLTTTLQIPSDSEHQNAYFAAQFYSTDGPFKEGQDFNRFNLFGKFHTHLSPVSKLVLSVGAFSSAWDASGQIPQRAVNSGLINRFDGIDNLEGGTTGRQNLNLEYHLKNTDNSKFKIQTYGSNYDFKLFSNFTLFLEDTINGDMIEQVDERKIYGLNTQYQFSKFFGNTHSTTTIAGGFRSDDIALNLWKSPGRVRNENLVNSQVAERNFYLWLQQQFLFGPQFRLQFGLRNDYFTFNVQDYLDNNGNELSLPHASGYFQKSAVNPKINFVYSPTSNLDIFVNGGTGFHSNDARDIVIRKKTKEIITALKTKGANQDDIAAALANRNLDFENQKLETLPKAYGAELGFRTHLFNKLNFGIAAWILDLEKELVYVGDAGTTEISGATRRIGIDIETRYQLIPWIWLDSDINISDGKFKNLPNGEDEIPLAPRFTSTGGLSMIHPSGIDMALRYRHIGDRPANENNSVTAMGYTILNAHVGYKFQNMKIMMLVENILNTEWNEAQFDTESRLQHEAVPVSEIHFTPGNPRNIRFGISYDF